MSPVFDVARSLLLVETEQNAGARRHSVPLTAPEPLPRAALLRQLGVDVLLCGAISLPLQQAVTSSGIRVVPNVCGSVEEIVGAFLGGRLRGNAFLMPGCGRRRHRWGHRPGGG